METEDLGILLEMAHVEGWSSEMLEFELYTQLNPDGCFTCIADNNVVGGVMTFAYPNSGWIGNLVVDRQYRLKGLGKALFRRALRRLSHLPTQLLCASPMAVGLYSSFGFNKVIDIFRWECKDRAFIPVNNEPDLKKILRLDKKYWNEDRSKMLEAFIEHRSYLCNNSACFGYGKNMDHWTIGPWIGNDRDAAAEILDRSMIEKKGDRILVDVPAQNTSAWDILNALGFEVVGKTVFMCKGKFPDIAFDNIYGFASMGSKG